MFESSVRDAEAGNRTASLDRIDSSQPYVVTNIQWVHKDVNLMKMDLDEDWFVALCWVVTNHKNHKKMHPRNEKEAKLERDKMLAAMQVVSNKFYKEAQATKVHGFLEFCGLMNEFIKVCQAASDKGIDFTQANRHSGAALPIETYHAAYVGEKLGCIYGPSLSQPEVFKAFFEALELPFDIKIEPKVEDAEEP